MKWLLAGVVAAMLLVVAARFVFGHENGHPNWITEHHPACCGIEDCAPIRVNDYVIREDGVWLPESKELIPMTSVKESEDFRPWRCINLDTLKTRCLFIVGSS
jgi:hypothetical protein